jgi:hypothetical protein
MTHLLSFFIKKKIKKNKKETLKTRVEGNLSLSLSLSREPSRPVPTNQPAANDRPTLAQLSRTQQIQLTPTDRPAANG